LMPHHLSSVLCRHGSHGRDARQETMSIAILP
jgi:hypothetical protein